MKDTGVQWLARLTADGKSVNPKYKEILRLDKMLDLAGIYHELLRHADGWEIIYYGIGDTHISDAIEHYGSYGQEDDKLEIMGLTSEGYDVEGWLSAEDVFTRWKNHWMECIAENTNCGKGEQHE